MAINHVLLAGAAALVVAGCGGTTPRAGQDAPARPAAAVVALPPRVPPPAPPAVLPAPMPAPAADWQDAPLPDGTWSYGPLANGSAAWFGSTGMPARAVLVCDRSAIVVDIVVATDAIGARDTATRPATIATSTASAAFGAAQWRGEGVSGLAIAVPANARILDAMAFSRGRFSVEIGGIAPVILPSWSEVGRVVEDCRG